MTSDQIQAWQLLCKQAVKSSGALRAYKSDAEAISDAKKSIAHLKDNIHHSRPCEEVFSYLLQIGDHDLIKAAFDHHSVDAFLELQKGHRQVSYKGAVARGDISLLRWLNDIGFIVSDASSIILRAGLERDCVDLFNFATKDLSLNMIDTRSQMPYYIRICGPNCAPLLDTLILENLDEWRNDLRNSFISACTKIDVKVAALLTLYDVHVSANQLPQNLLIKETAMYIHQYLTEFTASNHGKLRLIALQKDRVDVLGRPHLSDFMGLKRSEILMGNYPA
jgi:hypothetical protein